MLPESVRCSTCYQPYHLVGPKRPKSLACGHTYCGSCLVQLEVNGFVKCTLQCNKPQKASEVAVNFALENLLSHIYSVAKSGILMCQNHPNKTIDFVCLKTECLEEHKFICKFCLDEKKHYNHPISEFKSEIVKLRMMISTSREQREAQYAKLRHYDTCDFEKILAYYHMQGEAYMTHFIGKPLTVPTNHNNGVPPTLNDDQIFERLLCLNSLMKKQQDHDLIEMLRRNAFFEKLKLEIEELRGWELLPDEALCEQKSAIPRLEAPVDRVFMNIVPLENTIFLVDLANCNNSMFLECYCIEIEDFSKNSFFLRISKLICSDETECFKEYSSTVRRITFFFKGSPVTVCPKNRNRDTDREHPWKPEYALSVIMKNKQGLAVKLVEHKDGNSFVTIDGEDTVSKPSLKEAVVLVLDMYLFNKTLAGSL